MVVEKLTKVGLSTDDMLARGYQNASGTKHAIHLRTRKFEIAAMVQNGSGEDNVERAIGKRQALGKLLHHVNWQRRFRGQCTDCAGADDQARIRFERGNREAFPGKRVARDAASSADIERGASPALQKPRNGVPFAASEIALGRINHGVIIKGIEDKLPLFRLVSQPSHRAFPC